MSLHILKAGLQTTLQDCGRWGYQKDGIIVSGAMDLHAARIANLLVGNPASAATLEITLVGPKIQFQNDHLISLAGADLSPSIDDTPLPNWHLVFVKKGCILSFGAAKKGRFAYLAVAGGFDIAPVMGSTATYIRAGIGGYKGRALERGDVLPCNSTPEYLIHFQQQQPVANDTLFSEAPWTPAPDVLPHYEEFPTLRMIKGPEWALFSTESQRSVLEEPYIVSPRSDRMGYQLEGPALALDSPKELLSSAVSFGTIQVPVSGKPIVLLADHQTTGGYPRICQVATVDFSKLVQLQSGQRLRFEEISVKSAQELYIAQEERLAALKRAINFKLQAHR